MEDGVGEPQRGSVRFARDVQTAAHLFVEQIGALSDLTKFAAANSARLAEYGDQARALASSVEALPDHERQVFDELTSGYSPLTSTVPEVDDMATEIIKRVGNTRTAYAAVRALRLTVRRPSRQAALYNALTASLAAALEALVSNVASSYFRHFRAAIQAGEKEQRSIDIREVLDAATLDELVDQVVERRVESLMFGRLSAWRRFFKVDLKAVDIADHRDSYARVQELFERRNVVLHNGSIATTRYVRIARELPKHAELRQGQRLIADASYIDGVLEHVAALGGLLVAKVYSKFQRDKVKVCDLMAGASGDLLGQGRALACKWMCDLLWQEDNTDAETLLLARVNWWLARRRLGEDRDVILSEVEAWDVTTAEPRYQMAKYCLLGEFDSAIELINALLFGGELRLDHLRTWPLFEEMREYDAFKKLRDTPNTSGKNT